jgi:hypothetical protein
MSVPEEVLAQEPVRRLKGKQLYHWTDTLTSNQICADANCLQVTVLHKQNWTENHGDAVVLV